MPKKISDKKNKKAVTLIKKSNDLIEARYKFDVWEMRIFLTLISHIRRDDNEFNMYRLWYRDIAKAFHLHKRANYDFLRKAVLSLMDKKFVVSTVVDGFRRKEVYHIIRKVNYLEEGQEGKKGYENQEYVDLKIEEEMKPLLLQLQKSFTAYDLENVVNLGVYAIRIYELLKQYETIGHRLLGFEELKTMFELENEYPEFANFYRRVIEPSVSEINETTDLFISDVEKLKEGKKIMAIRFKFHKNTAKQTNPAPLVLDISPLSKEEKINNLSVTTTKSSIEIAEQLPSDADTRFMAFYARVVEGLGITPTVFIDLLKIYNDVQFEQAIRVTHRAKIEGQIKTNISGFFVQALKKGFTDQKEERLKKDKKEETQKAYAKRLADYEADKENRIFDRIKHITGENPYLTLAAIEVLKFTEMGKNAIEMEAAALERPLEVEDYRRNKVLRKLLIETLYTENIDEFSDILADHESKLLTLKEKSLF
jgi:plasmid replication initiation protein